MKFTGRGTHSPSIDVYLLDLFGCGSIERWANGSNAITQVWQYLQYYISRESSLPVVGAEKSNVKNRVTG